MAQKTLIVSLISPISRKVGISRIKSGKKNHPGYINVK